MAETPHTWDPAEPTGAVSCACGHEALAYYDEHQAGCLGGRFCCCTPAPTIGCAYCDQGLPNQARARLAPGRED